MATKVNRINKRVMIRRDRDKNQWAILDSRTYKPVEHFTNGILKNVQFVTKELDKVPAGCGTYDKKSVGVAIGTLVKSAQMDLKRVRHLSFKEGGFADLTGKLLTKVSAVYLGDAGNSVFVQ